jgi:hypothetical protein
MLQENAFSIFHLQFANLVFILDIRIEAKSGMHRILYLSNAYSHEPVHVLTPLEM